VFQNSKNFTVGAEGFVMSGFAMKNGRRVFLPLLKPCRYNGSHGARGGAPEGKRNGLPGTARVSRKTSSS
jgi:hypothetical protein